MEIERDEIQADCPLSKVQSNLTARYIRMLKGDLEYIQKINEDDKYIKRALDFITNKKTTMALLSQDM